MLKILNLRACPHKLPPHQYGTGPRREPRSGSRQDFGRRPRLEY